MLSDYQNYFRQLAISHKDIQHDPLSETGNAKPGTRRYAQYNTDEIIKGLSTAVSFPALLVENYEINTEGDDQVFPEYKFAGAFNVFVTGDKNKSSSVNAALDKAEKIMFEILQRIHNEMYGEEVFGTCNVPFEDFDFTSLEMISFGPVLNSEYGWRCSFNFNPVKIFDITDEPKEGVWKHG